MLDNLETMNDVFAEESYDLDNIFEKLQAVSEGKLSEDEASPIQLSGDDEYEIRKSNDWRIHCSFKQF